MKNLIDDQGQVTLGLLDKAPEIVNYEDFDLHNNMDKPITGFSKKMAVNQFQFIGLTGDDFILGVAIINLKWLSSCFVYVYEPKTKAFKEYSWIKPFAFNTQTSNQPNNGNWCFTSGKNKIEISCENGRRHLKINMPKVLHVDIAINESNDYQPLNVCCRAGYNGWVFTQKATALAFDGIINWQGSAIDNKNLLASIDWSCGYMRRETCWLWASLSHQTKDGTKVGFNLAAGVNENPDTENGLWVNNEFIKIERADFTFNRKNRMDSWQVKSSDGYIDLTFEPIGERKEKMNAIFMASNFTQLFGYFSGIIKDQRGKKIIIENAIGFCEDHFAKW